MQGTSRLFNFILLDCELKCSIFGCAPYVDVYLEANDMKHSSQNAFLINIVW